MPGVGEGETLAPADVLGFDGVDDDAVALAFLRVDEKIERIDLGRDLEQHPVLHMLAAGRRVQRPGSVLQGEVEFGGVIRFVGQPLRDRHGVGDLVEFSGENLLQPGFESGAVERCRLVRLDLVAGAALHEMALDRVQRRKLVMACGERAEFRPDAEQLGEKVIEVRRDLEDQRRFGLGVERRGIFPRGREPRFQRRVGGAEKIEKGGVELFEAGAAVEFGEGEAERRLQHPVGACGISAPGA